MNHLLSWVEGVLFGATIVCVVTGLLYNSNFLFVATILGFAAGGVGMYHSNQQDRSDG